MGKIHVLALSGLSPCPDGQLCPKYEDALLTLLDVEADAAIADDDLVRLHRGSEPIHCQIVDENKPAFDCGEFVNGRIATVEGLFTKNFRDVYYLLID